MSRAFGEITIGVRADRLADVERVIQPMCRKHVFNSCWHTMRPEGIEVVLTFQALTRETLQAIEAIHEAAWPGLFDSMRPEPIVPMTESQALGE